MHFDARCCLCFRIDIGSESNCPIVGPGTIGGAPSVGSFYFSYKSISHGCNSMYTEFGNIFRSRYFVIELQTLTV